MEILVNRPAMCLARDTTLDSSSLMWVPLLYIIYYYFYNLFCDQVKTKTATGVEFSTGGSSNIDSGKVSGNLETKYQVKDLGMTLTEKWTTDNNLSTTVDVVDKLIPGAKISLDTKFAPGTGAKSGNN